MSERPAALLHAATIQVFCESAKHPLLPDGRRSRKNVRLLDVQVWDLQGEEVVMIRDVTPGAKRSRADIQADAERLREAGKTLQPGTDAWPAMTHEPAHQALHVVDDEQTGQRVVWDFRCPDRRQCRCTVPARLEHLQTITHTLAASGLSEVSLQGLASRLKDARLKDAARRSAK